MIVLELSLRFPLICSILSLSPPFGARLHGWHKTFLSVDVRYLEESSMISFIIMREYRLLCLGCTHCLSAMAETLFYGLMLVSLSDGRDVSGCLKRCSQFFPESNEKWIDRNSLRAHQ